MQSTLTYAELARQVRAQIGQQHRYDHTVRVARCADALSQRHGIDAGKARLAGMLHDLARLYSPERLVAECRARDMPVDDFEQANPLVLHARLGARIASESFGVHDSQVLSAIEKHTTAAAAMSPLDCAVYLADGLEPARDFSERAALWQLAMRDLAAGMRETLAHTVRHLTAKGIPVAPQTLAALHTFSVEKESSVSAT